jgi:hypothetical protein
MKPILIAGFATTLVAAIAVVSAVAIAESNKAEAPPATKSTRKTEPAKIPPRPRGRGERCATLHGATATEYYCASSVLRPQGGNRYTVDHLFSNSGAETWAEGKRGPGIGEWITIAFKERRLVEAVIIRNGYQKNQNTFSKNGRVRQFRLVFSQGETQTLAIEDTMELQRIPLEPAVPAYWVQFIIDEVYPGSAYEDTSITKLWVTNNPE